MKTIKPIAAILALFFLVVTASSWDYEIEQTELTDWAQVIADSDAERSENFRLGRAQ